jgi:hypothetical protein
MGGARACAVQPAARPGQPAAAASRGGGDAGPGPPGRAVLRTASPQRRRGARLEVPACRTGLARLGPGLHRRAVPGCGRAGVPAAGSTDVFGNASFPCTSRCTSPIRRQRNRTPTESPSTLSVRCDAVRPELTSSTPRHRSPGSAVERHGSVQLDGVVVPSPLKVSAGRLIPLPGSLVTLPPAAGSPRAPVGTYPAAQVRRARRVRPGCRVPALPRRVLHHRRNDPGGRRCHPLDLSTQSLTAEMTATTPHQDSPGLTATAAHGEVVTSRQVAARN